MKRLNLSTFCCCVIGLIALAVISYQIADQAGKDAYNFFLSSGGVSEKNAFDATMRLDVVSKIQSGVLLLTAAVLIVVRSTRRRSEIAAS